MNKPKETEPFMFVYYRGTNSTALCEREKNDFYYQKCKYPMDNLRIGHLLFRLAQQLLCENDDKKTVIGHISLLQMMCIKIITTSMATKK